MIYSIKGEIVYKGESSVAIECMGVAFSCSVSYNTLRLIGGLGSEVRLFTHLSVREDAMELFGFLTEDELSCFRRLITVSGVGPKAALAVLSEFSPDKLALAVASGDVKSVTRAQGVGPKLAQRIVLELKDKLGSGFGSQSDAAAAVGAVMQTDNTGSAVAALTQLGYTQSEAALAVSRLDPSLPDTELIRLALKAMASRL